MDIYTFLSLNKKKQANAVVNNVFLSEIVDGSFKVKLYSVEDFYVEAFYTAEEDEVVKFKAFKSRRLLVPYLDNFKIEELA